MSVPRAWVAPLLAGLAAGFGLAALLVVLFGGHHTDPQAARAHDQLCALMGAIMDDNDTPTGVFANVAALYREDGCR